MSSRVLVLFLLMLLIPSAINAAESENDFDVELLPIEGQKSFSAGYFDITADSGQSISLNLRITNNSDEPIELRFETADARTAEEGGILYSTIPFEEHDNQIRLSDLVDIQETITIPAQGVEDVHYHIDAPHDVSGTILGGIMMTDGSNSESSSLEIGNNGGSNYTFKKQGQQLIAVKLNYPDSSASSFSLKKVRFDNDLLTIKVSNSNSAVIENVHGTYTIMDKDGESLITGDIAPFAMAPKSNIRYPINLKGHVFEEGKYVLMIKGSADKKEFFAEEMFSVSESHPAAIASEASAPSTGASTWIYITAIALAGVLLLLPLLLKILRRNVKSQYLDLSEKNNQ